MEKLSGKHSKAMLAVACLLSLAGVVFLVWGEAGDVLWVFIDGLIIFAAGVACYYAAGEYRLAMEWRFRRLSSKTKFFLLLLSCAPWIVMYLFIAPLWDFLLVAVFSLVVCAGYVWVYPGVRGEKKVLEHERDGTLDYQI